MAPPGSRTLTHRAMLVAWSLFLLQSTPSTTGSVEQARAEPQAKGSLDSEEDRVLQVVETFIDRLGRQRIYALAPLLAENAVVITARQRSMGYETVVEPASVWLTRMSEAPNPEPFEERIFSPTVTIDSGHLATVRADFEVIRRGVKASSGVDIFTLIRKPDAWQVASIAYTFIPVPRD